ncbi:MAG: DoxX family protein [Candidatus Riflebacteria bacterium HGW-Riflebacteria-2]|nr:MAG: DoxX family protein [Candidatus Riflebacteria bacterium HGW-Riflebacteria-2]
MTDTTSIRLINCGLFVLRVGFGIVMMIHGVPKLMAGPELWAKLGTAMGVFGIHFAPTFWGFMAAFSEGIGGLFLVLGLGVRVFAALLAFTMLVATLMHYMKGDTFSVYSHALSLAIVFFSLMICGGGNWSIGARIKAMAGRWFQ